MRSPTKPVAGVVSRTLCAGFVAALAPAVAAYTPNQTCQTATMLTVPQAPFVSSTLNTGNSGAIGNPPGFHSITATEFSAGIFYKFTPPSDQQLTVSTCLYNQTPPNGEPTQTDFNTLLTVFCGACGSLKTIGDNDDAPASECTLNSTNPGPSVGASILRFPAKAGQQYTLYLTGANGNQLYQGFFWLSITTGMIDPHNPPVLCPDIIDPPCAITIPPADANNIYEQTFCDTAAQDNNDDPCAASPNDTKTISLGQTAWGTVATTIGLNRDNDWWRLLPTQSVYRVTFTAEAPLLVAVFTSDCPFPGNLTGTELVIPPCNQEYFDFAPPGTGASYLRVRPTALSGLPCGSRNKYKFKLEAIPPGEYGACCRSLSPTCSITTRDACTNQSSPDGSVIGVFAGAGTVCQPDHSAPCDELVHTDQVTQAGSIGATLDPVGACCQQTGTCTLTTQAACPNVGANGATWTVKFTRPTSCPDAGGPPCPYPAGTDLHTVCDPFPCNGLNYQRCCFTNGTCRYVGPTLCVQLGGTSSPGACLPLACCVCVYGACCRTNASSSLCTTERQSDCTGGNPAGQWKGANTICSPNPCTGLCCAGTLCIINLKEACIALQAGAKYTLGSTGPCPGTNTSPCCRANYNHQGVITVQDLFDFLAAWFVHSPLANINGGTVTVQDLFDFLAAWFAGACN